MMRKLLFVICFILCITSVLSAANRAGVVQAGDDNRRVLALYDSEDGKILSANTHILLEMPLNRLGMIVEYHNINNTAYPDATKYRAIVVWLSNDISDKGKEYYAFVTAAAQAGVRIILMSGPGVVQDTKGRQYDDEAAVLLAALDIKEGDIGYLKNPFTVVCDKIEKDAFDFEVDDTGGVPVYRDYRITGGMKPWMTVARTDVADSTAVAIAVGDKGGFVSDSEMAVRYIDEPVWGVLWDLDPFKFLTAALGVEGSLRPDVTTSYGLRSGFMHIDGDGSSNLTLDISKEQQPCTQVLREKLLEAYNFPISVSVIAYRITPEGSMGERFVNELREIMKLPNVQAASHTYSHPMTWDTGVLGFKIPGYTFDPAMETVGSMEMIKEVILPEGKDIELLLWSGDCQATEEALAALDSVGFQNLNGGNARMDALYEGICHICPLTIQVGKYRQYYAPAGNEYLYTNSWTDNYGGFALVIDTFENTEKPRYIPVNVYYHLYLTERQAGLKSLITVYDWCTGQELNWLHVGEYTREVTGFLNAVTGINEKGNYYIKNYEGLKTVRLDSESRNVDMGRSANVLGFNHFDGSLYVALLPGTEAEIVLTDSVNTGIYLDKSTSVLRNVKMEGGRITGELRLYVAGFIEFGGVAGKISVELEGRELAAEKSEGHRYPLRAGSGEWVRFEVVAE